ncbi:MAG: restriction endonuclease subunit S [Sphingomonadales bacterium]|jgi:type I restriction enzyme S subunit
MEAIATKAIFQKYPAYKDSGVEWLGEIPEHWEIGKLGTLLKPVSIKNRPDLPLLSITREAGVIERNLEDDSENHNFIPDDLSGYKVLNEGQFGMNKMKAWQGSYGIAPMRGIVSPAYYVFDFNSSINPRFFHLAIRSKNYVAFFGQASDGVRVGQWDLSKTRMKEIPFFIPPLPEQTAIAAFLDEKTTKIDRAIAQKEKMIALLKERKQIIIQNAVTKGLDPNAKMKDSGVEWIGEIPEGWEVKRLKSEIDLLTGYPFQSNKYTDHGIKLARGINVKEGVFNWDDLRCWPVITKELERYQLAEGDVLIAMDGSKVGKNFCQVKSTDLPILLLQRVARLRPLSTLDKDYLYWNIANRNFLDWVNISKTDPMVPHIAPKDINGFIIPVPPKKEQAAIVNHIETQSTKIDKAIKLQEQQIEKLKELKSTLIDSAVTGKIKVS